MIKKLWKYVNENKIARTVVGGLILAGLLKLFGLIFSINIYTIIIKFLRTRILLEFWWILILLMLFFVFGLLWNKERYTKEQRKLRKFNNYEDKENGILFKWDVNFDPDGKPYISDLTPFCIKHPPTPLRMLRDDIWIGGFGEFKCSVPDCPNRIRHEQMTYVENYFESVLLAGKIK